MQREKTFCGISVRGTKICSVTASASTIVAVGDTVLQVDGRDVTAQDIAAALVGSDVIGSQVHLKIQRERTGEIVNISLARSYRQYQDPPTSVPAGPPSPVSYLRPLGSSSSAAITTTVIGSSSSSSSAAAVPAVRQVAEKKPTSSALVSSAAYLSADRGLSPLPVFRSPTRTFADDYYYTGLSSSNNNENNNTNNNNTAYNVRNASNSDPKPGSNSSSQSNNNDAKPSTSGTANNNNNNEYDASNADVDPSSLVSSRYNREKPSASHLKSLADSGLESPSPSIERVQHLEANVRALQDQIAAARLSSSDASQEAKRDLAWAEELAVAKQAALQAEKRANMEALKRKQLSEELRRVQQLLSASTGNIPADANAEETVTLETPRKTSSSSSNSNNNEDTNSTAANRVRQLEEQLSATIARAQLERTRLEERLDRSSAQLRWSEEAAQDDRKVMGAMMTELEEQLRTALEYREQSSSKNTSENRVIEQLREELAAERQARLSAEKALATERAAGEIERNALEQQVSNRTAELDRLRQNITASMYNDRARVAV